MKKLFFLLFVAFVFNTVFAKPSRSTSARRVTATRTTKKASVKSSNTEQKKNSAEAQHKKITAKIDSLKKEIVHTEKAKGEASANLSVAEQEVANTQNTLQSLAQKQSQTEQKLGILSAQQRDLQNTVYQQQKRLARILRAQYMSGSENRLKMLFSGDNPNRVAREMRYMGYFSSAYTQLIASFRQNVKAVKNKRTEVSNARAELDDIVAKTSIQKSLLEKKKAEHAALVAQLTDKLSTQKRMAKQLEQDEARLSGLINQLDKQIQAARLAEQRRYEQEQAAERRRLQRLKEERLARQRAAKAKKPTYTTSPSKGEEIDPIASERNIQAPVEQHTPVERTIAPPVVSSVHSGRMPLNGAITASYGSKRSDGPSWKGIFISASEGSPVHAAASGRVVYAGFLRGYGNLVIVDHGNRYMTIYANVHSINKSAGSSVAERETIATAGNSGENMQTGLYFEVRRAGRAINPMEWLR